LLEKDAESHKEAYQHSQESGQHSKNKGLESLLGGSSLEDKPSTAWTLFDDVVQGGCLDIVPVTLISNKRAFLRIGSCQKTFGLVKNCCSWLKHLNKTESWC